MTYSAWEALHNLRPDQWMNALWEKATLEDSADNKKARRT